MIMFTFDFDSWSDVLLGHYVLTLFISITAVLATFVISRKQKVHMTSTERHFVCSDEEDKLSNLIKETSCQNGNNKCLKQSPALVAQKVIQGNMTDEQRLLEYQVREQQLAQIYELMQRQSDKFGDISLSEVQEQMKLYQ